MKNELRIGNYIQRNDLGNGHNRIERVLELGQLTCTTTGPIKVISGYLDISGVPLSEEWLIKAGFRLQSVSKHDFKFNDVVRTDKLYTTNPFNLEDQDTFEIEVIKNSDDNEVRRIGIKGIDYLDAQDIDFVHQLQNLYFALTGEELEFKL